MSKDNDLEKKIDNELADIAEGEVTLSESPLGDDGFADHMDRLRASNAPMGSLKDLEDSLKKD